MLQRVEIHNIHGQVLSLPIFGSITSGIVVSSISGLDPVKANLVSSSFANQDGSQHQSARRENRNIVMNFLLEPHFGGGTIREIRNKVYEFLMPKSRVVLKFVMSDGLTVDISGRVETCETPMFAREPSLSASIICNEPDFVDLNLIEFNGFTTFDETETDLTYAGTVETGITLTLEPDRAINEITFYHRPPSEDLVSLEFEAPLAAGDLLVITTVPGSKSATLTRGGTVSDILYGISPYSKWIELQPGLNKIRLYAEGAGIPYRIEYTNKYGGL